MVPMPYDPIATVQEAIADLLRLHEPAFLGIGLRMYLSFATILVTWYGIRLMLASRGSGEAVFGLARLLLLVSFGFAMLRYYEDPLPGIGVSFTNLITDQTAHLASVLSARSIQNAQSSLNTLWNALEQPVAASRPYMILRIDRQAHDQADGSTVDHGMAGAWVQLDHSTWVQPYPQFAAWSRLQCQNATGAQRGLAPCPPPPGSAIEPVQTAFRPGP